MSLKEVLHAVRNTASSQAWVVKLALQNWLEAVEQMPRHPCNPYTAATMQAAQKACRQAPPNLHLGSTSSGQQASLDWLQQYIPDVSIAVAAQLDEQVDISLKRLKVLENLRGRLPEQPAHGQQHASSALGDQAGGIPGSLDALQQAQAQPRDASWQDQNHVMDHNKARTGGQQLDATSQQAVAVENQPVSTQLRQRKSAQQSHHTTPQQFTELHQQQAKSQLGIHLVDEAQVCALLRCALEAYREVGAVAAFVDTIGELQELTAAAQRKHQSRDRQLVSAAEIMLNMYDEVLCVVRRSHAAHELWLAYAELSASLNALWDEPLNYVPALTRERSEHLVSATAISWLSAAAKFPFSGLHHVTEVMLVHLVDWASLLNNADCYQTEEQLYIGDLMCTVLAREGLRAEWLRYYEPQKMGTLLRAYKVTAQRMQQLGLPQTVQQELLSWMEQAAAAESGKSDITSATAATAACSSNDMATYDASNTAGSHSNTAVSDDRQGAVMGAGGILHTGISHKGAGGRTSSTVTISPQSGMYVGRFDGDGNEQGDFEVAAASQHVSTDSSNGVVGGVICSNITSGNTRADTGANGISSINSNNEVTGISAGLGDMQELLNMMYGLGNLIEHASVTDAGNC